VTHTYIQAIKQPTLGYLTRSVRRRAATSKRRYLPSSYQYAERSGGQALKRRTSYITDSLFQVGAMK
jgi:hypothetical protein